MEFEFEDGAMLACQAVFNQLDPEKRLFMTHYELAKQTNIDDSQIWKKFLTDGRVSQWLDQELNLYKNVTLRKMIQGATSNDRSIGAAQMINAITKTIDDTSQKEGATFIYSYVPPNPREVGIPNLRQETTDIFERS
jgi:hypothetical protein